MIGGAVSLAGSSAGGVVASRKAVVGGISGFLVGVVPGVVAGLVVSKCPGSVVVLCRLVVSVAPRVLHV